MDLRQSFDEESPVAPVGPLVVVYRDEGGEMRCLPSTVFATCAPVCPVFLYSSLG